MPARSRFSLEIFTAVAILLLVTPISTTSSFAQPVSEAAGGPPTTAQLLKSLESDVPRIAASAARSLGVVFAPGGRGGEDRNAVVAKLIEHVSSKKDPEIRRQCAIALGEIQAKEAADAVQETLQDSEIEVVLAAGEAIAKILPVDEAREFLTSVEQPLAKVGAYNGLSKIAKPVDAEYLLTGVASENWQAQKAAVEGLRRAVSAGAELDEEQYKSIATVLGADTLNAAGAAVQFFTHTHNANAVAALRDAVDPEIHPDNWRQRAMGLRAIYHRGWPRSRPELHLVVRNLGDSVANVNNECYRIINDIREDHHVHLHHQMPILVDELERAGPLSRRGAIMKLMPHDIENIYASRVAVVAAKTLTEASEDGEAWPAQVQALRVIGATKYSGCIEEVCASVNSNVGNVRSAAGDTLQRLGAVCPEEEAAKVAPLLHTHLENAIDWRKSAIAAGAIGAYANEETVAPLISLLAHDVLNVRQAASQSLVLIAKENDELRPKVDELLYDRIQDTPDTWQYGAPVLAALGDVKALPLLTRILLGDDWRAQEAAAKAVKDLAANNVINDKALSKALVTASQSRVLQVQRACDLALRELTKQQE